MFWFDMEDDKAVAKIMKQYRLKTKSAAVRLALKMAIATPANNSTVRSSTLAQASKIRPAKQEAKRKKTKHGLVALAELAKKYPLSNLPEDFSERLDHYLYDHFLQNVESES
jgi:Arc/MetJ family transcription regulator